MLFSGEPANELINQFAPLKIGGGGWVTRINGSSDGTLVCRSDTADAYIRIPGATEWVSLLSARTIPRAYLNALVNPDGVTQPYRFPDQAGAYDCQIDPSDSNNIWMFFYKNLFVSRDRGATFSVVSAYPTLSAVITGAVRPICYNAQHIAIDPNNSNVVYASDKTNIYVSTVGGVTFSAALNPGTIPSASTSSTTGGYSIIFDTTGGTSGGRTKNIYIGSWGNPVYVSTDAGATFASTGVSSPTQIEEFAVDSNGTLWAVSGSLDVSGNVYSYASGSWTTALTATGDHIYRGVAVVPGVGGKVIALTAYGELNVWNGSAWSGRYAFTRAAGDVPWLATTLLHSSYMDASGIVVDPLDPTKLWMTCGIGVFTTTPVPTATGFVWTAVTAGIENLVAKNIISTIAFPGNVLLGVQDKAMFNISDFSSYPSVNIPNINPPGRYLDDCWDMDYASSDPTYICALKNNPGNSTDLSGFTTNCGPDFQKFTVAPVSPILVTNAQTLDDAALHFADPVTAAMFNGLSFTATRDQTFGHIDDGAGGAGNILTVTSTVMPLGPGQVVFGATGNPSIVAQLSGTPNGAGTYSISGSAILVASTQFTISVSGTCSGAASGGDVPTTANVTIGSGITVTFLGPYGGCIAASTPDNIIVVPVNTKYPLYTKDGGTTWGIIDLSSFSVPTSGTTGWGSGNANRAKIAVADRKNANTFYLYNSTVAAPSWNGIYKSIDGGDSWTQELQGRIPNTGNPFMNYLAAVPYYSGGYDTAGHLFYTDGKNDGATPLKFSDGGGATGTWHTVTGAASEAVIDVAALGFGKPKASGGYPTLFIWGRVAGDWGIFRGDNFNPSTYKVIWRKLTQYASDNLDIPFNIAGDANVFGTCYISFPGSGFAYGELTN